MCPTTSFETHQIEQVQNLLKNTIIVHILICSTDTKSPNNALPHPMFGKVLLSCSLTGIRNKDVRMLERTQSDALQKLWIGLQE